VDAVSLRTTRLRAVDGTLWQTSSRRPIRT